MSKTWHFYITLPPALILNLFLSRKEIRRTIFLSLGPYNNFLEIDWLPQNDRAIEPSKEHNLTAAKVQGDLKPSAMLKSLK